MSDKRYLVFYTGRTKPGLDIETVRSNLVLSLGIAEDKAQILLDGGRKLLKRCATTVDAQVLAEKFDQAGILCDVCDGVKGVSSPGVESGSENSLVRALKGVAGSDRDHSSSLISRLIRPSARHKHA